VKKILVYSHDTYGLGNIRRMMAVVEHLVRKSPGVSVLVLSGSPMMHAFRLSQGIDYIKMPCLTRSQDGQYSPKYLSLSYDKVLGLRADLILNTVLEFEPDVIIVDKKPMGVQNELAPMLDVLRKKAARPKLVLLLREILDDPESTISIWERNRYHDVIRELYDSVLVLGSREIFDTASEYNFPPSTVAKLDYCGYIAKQPGRRARAHIRSSLALDDRPLAMVTAGGGEDGYRLLHTYLSGCGAGKNLQSLVFVGPEMAVSQQQELRAMASSLPDVRLLEFSDDVMSYMNAADLIVSMAGYNTMTEILSLRKPAVVVPRIRPVEEQWIRATRLERLGLVSVIHPDQLTPERLFASIERQLDPAAAQGDGKMPPMDALDRIAGRIEELLRERDQNGWSQLLSDTNRLRALSREAVSMYDAATDYPVKARLI